MRTSAIVAAGILTALATSAAQAAILVNGGLELGPGLSPVVNENLFYAASNFQSTALPGWTITGPAGVGTGAVDVIPATYFSHTEGSYCIDLIGTPNRVGGGNGVGGIQQDAPTIIGNKYTLTFDFTVNPEDFTNEMASTKSLLVEALRPNGTVIQSQTFTLPVGTRTKTNLQWTSQSLTQFTALDSATTIRLSAITPTGLAPTVTSYFCGPLVDNIFMIDNGSSNPTPEPASLAVLGAGGLLLLQRKRRSGRSA